MKTNAESGREGEQKAADYLKSLGWTILAQNYRFKRGEIDIIAKDNDVLVFVEVKYRKTNMFGFPEDFVDDNKVGMIRKTAMEFLIKENWEKDIRFDIISITGALDLEHFEDAF